MNIRKAEPREAAKLREIVDLAHRNGGFPEDWVEQLESESPTSDSFLSSHLVFVSEEAGEILGFYALSADDRLEQLFVRPDLIGTGCGKELFLHAMERVAR